MQFGYYEHIVYASSSSLFVGSNAQVLSCFFFTYFRLCFISRLLLFFLLTLRLYTLLVQPSTHYVFAIVSSLQVTVQIRNSAGAVLSQNSLHVEANGATSSVSCSKFRFWHSFGCVYFTLSSSHIHTHSLSLQLSLSLGIYLSLRGSLSLPLSLSVSSSLSLSRFSISLYLCQSLSRSLIFPLNVDSLGLFNSFYDLSVVRPLTEIRSTT